jgi:two-component system, cell cycle sensor histidine kinase and response regulator CckA
VGRGTTFRVYLPAATSAFENEAGSIAPATSRGDGELILVADDEESIRQLAGMILAGAGYRTLSASDGIEAAALFIANASEIKLVITDFDMPNLNGAGLASAIHAIDPAMKILAMSGLLSTSRTRKVRPETFATTSIAKPFDATTLLSMVAQLLDEPAEAP